MHRMPLPGSVITGLSDELCALCSVLCGLCWHVLSAEACTFVTLTTDQCVNKFAKSWSAQAVFLSYCFMAGSIFPQQGTPARSSGIKCEIQLPQARNMRLNIVSCCECRLFIGSGSAQTCTMAVCSNPLCLVQSLKL